MLFHSRLQAAAIPGVCVISSPLAYLLYDATGLEELSPPSNERFSI